MNRAEGRKSFIEIDREVRLTAINTLPALEPRSASRMDDEVPAFDAPGLVSWLEDVDAADLDRLQCGALGFDDEGTLRQYNKVEAAGSGVDASRLLGQNVFFTVAPCMNNYLVAQRFEDALQHGQALDEIVDFVLTWRMRPTHVKLRLVAVPGMDLRYVFVERRVPAV
jgi:photoactive yellow protein